MEIEFGKMCMYSIALVSVDMVSISLHVLEGLAVEAMDPGVILLIGIFSNFVAIFVKPPSSSKFEVESVLLEGG